MAKIVKKETINVIETANSFELYETVAIPQSLIAYRTLRTYLTNGKNEKTINGVFTVTDDQIGKMNVMTRIR